MHTLCRHLPISATFLARSTFEGLLSAVAPVFQRYHKATIVCKSPEVRCRWSVVHDCALPAIVPHACARALKATLATRLPGEHAFGWSMAYTCSFSYRPQRGYVRSMC